MQAADLAAAIADYPCVMWVGQARLAVIIGDVSLSPFADIRGIVEDGSILAYGKTSELRAAGGVTVSAEVQVQRYGEDQPRWYTVHNIRMDDVGYELTLLPTSTERRGGVML